MADDDEEEVFWQVDENERFHRSTLQSTDRTCGALPRDRRKVKGPRPCFKSQSKKVSALQLLRKRKRQGKNFNGKDGKTKHRLQKSKVKAKNKS